MTAECQRCGHVTTVTPCRVQGYATALCDDCLRSVRHTRARPSRLQRGVNADRWPV